MPRAFLHTQPIKASQTSAFTIWHLVAIVFILKIVLLGIDGQPRVSLGDSASYLATALVRLVPPDRSFTYGLFIRALTKVTLSLHLVVLAQVMVSAASAALVGFALQRYTGATKRIALSCALLCAVEPLQLLSERFILTEALCTLLFGVLVVFALRYLCDGDMAAVLVIPVVGAALVSLRVAFLPVVLASSVLLPFLSPTGLELVSAFRTRSTTLAWRYGRVVFGQLVLLLILTNACLFLYQSWYGKKIGGPPAYIEESGLFMISDVAPILQPADFVDTDLRGRLFARQLLDLHDRSLRTGQRFASNGLSRALLDVFAPHDEVSGQARASEVAQAAAIHAVKRDPAGFVQLVFQNIADYFSWHDVHTALLLDEFRDQPIPAGTQEMFRKFGFDEPRQSAAGFTMIWHEYSELWCMFLIVMPLLASVFLFVPGLPGKPQLLLLMVYAWALWGVSTITVEHDTPRFLTALAWLFFLILGVLWTGLAQRRQI